MSLEQLYLQAQKDCIHRYDFLGRIDLGKGKKYVSDIIYVPSNHNKFNPDGDRDSTMYVRPRWITENFGFPGFKSKIVVFDPAFTFSFPFFLSAVLDHEVFHAQEFYENPRVIRAVYGRDCFQEAVKYAETEIRACENQLKYAKYRGLSKEEIARINQQIADFRESIVAQRELAKEF